LLRRMNLLQGDFFQPSTTSNQMTLFQKKVFKMPVSPGYVPGAYSQAYGIATGTTATLFTYNWCTFTYMSYFSQGFLAYRGSVNYTFNVLRDGSPFSHVRAFRDNLGLVKDGGLDTGTNKAFVRTAPVTYSSVSAAAKFVAQQYSGMSGQSLVNNWTQSGLNVQLPNYSPYSFCFTGAGYANVPPSDDGSADDGLVFEIITPPEFNSANRCLVTTYVGAGTDFGFYCFINVPALYYYGSTPNTA